MFKKNISKVNWNLRCLKFSFSFNIFFTPAKFGWKGGGNSVTKSFTFVKIENYFFGYTTFSLILYENDMKYFFRISLQFKDLFLESCSFSQVFWWRLYNQKTKFTICLIFLGVSGVLRCGFWVLLLTNRAKLGNK